MATMAFDALAALRQGGHWVDQLPAGQRQVFAELTEDEVDLLNRIKLRLDEAAPDVQGQELKFL
jgi:hypothetical protein